MKYIIAFFALSACGVWAAGTQNNLRFADNTAPETEKSSDKNSANSDGAVDSYSQPAYTDADDTASGRPDPIPALILPNNVCIINTDLAPNRSIEDHIVACIQAQRIRQSIRR